jgi:geranylgeranyl reductase family protein
MQTKYFPAVVIGGGPAGATAAFTLASSGVPTCLIDRRKFPRDKLCGGLLTLRTKKTFDRVFAGDWNNLIETTANGVQFCSPKGPIESLKNYSTLFFTQRYHFDNALLTMAQSAGCTVHLGNGVRQVDLSSNSIQLPDGTVIRYGYLIGADGVNSVVTKTLFGNAYDEKTIGFALEMDIPANLLPRAHSPPEIHFGVARWGYGWVFPKKGAYTVGMGGLYSLNPNLRTMFERFLITRLGTLPQIKIKGHFVPFGDYRRQPGRDNVLLCGDAAGLVDSITGEGIAFAMQSGNAAGLAVAAAIATSVDPLVQYLHEYSAITTHIKKSNFYRWFIFPQISEKLFLAAIPDASTIQASYLDLLAAEIEYEALPGRLWLQFRKGVRKITKTMIKRLMHQQQ